MRYLITIFLICFALSCVPYSEHPLTDPDPGKIDLSILGTWFWKDENESGFVHIGLDEKSKLLRLIMVDIDKDGELEVSEYFGHTSYLDGKNYLNLKQVSPQELKPQGFIFVKYILKKNAFGVAIMNSDGIVKAIEDGTLKGKVEKSKMDYSIFITEEQAKLQQFIIKNDRLLFPEINYLTKLELQNNISHEKGK